MILTNKHLKLNDAQADNFTFALIGNPNAGKSTVFNKLTGDNQHTGNWSGKTVEIAEKEFLFSSNKIRLVDLPGTYSLACDSPEETVTENFIKNEDYDCIIIVANSTLLKKSLLLTLQVLSKTQKAVVFLNMADEAKQRNLNIDIDELSLQLGIPVIMGSAKTKQGLDELINTSLSIAKGSTRTYIVRELIKILDASETYEQEVKNLISHINNILNQVIKQKTVTYSDKDRKLDRIFTSRLTGIPIMFLIFAFIFWLTAFGANYPSELLSSFFRNLKTPIMNLMNNLKFSPIFSGIIVDGIYTTVSWVISVMLPPALIFFPLFAILEECGYLPRVAFNLDRIFKKYGANGKLALTMLMGFGCNNCGVMGCRIINSKKERIVSAVTNSFIPCNGRFPTLFAIISIFLTGTCNGILKSFTTTVIMICLISLSFTLTLIVSVILSKTILKGDTSNLIMELPTYRMPNFLHTIFSTFKTKVLYVLSRAVAASVPAGILIWALANIKIMDTSMLDYLTSVFEPFGKLIGLDGTIITGFILGFPANEIVMPAILMGYLNTGTLVEYPNLNNFGVLLSSNGWTITTALCVCVFTLFHFPCTTTCFAIKKETRSRFWTFMSILIPLTAGTVICYIISCVSRLLI